MWAAMGEASGTDVAAVMDTWTAQMGFPLLKVGYLVGEIGQDADSGAVTLMSEP